MMKLSAAVLALTTLIHSADGQAAKFAASWETGVVTLIDIDTATTGTPQTGELLATIKPPGGNKELLVGFSGVVNMLTHTEVEATNKGGKATASSEVTLNVCVKYGPRGSSNICSNGDIAAPGLVTFASRKQELSVEVDLDVICNATRYANGDEQAACELTASNLGIDGYVSVGLGLDTTAAHHFNFVIPNVPTGEFDILACYSGSGGTELSAEAGASSSVAAKLAISSRMITVQQVKAVNGPVVGCTSGDDCGGSLSDEARQALPAGETAETAVHAAADDASVTWGMTVISAMLGVISVLLAGHVYMLHKLTKSVTDTLGLKEYF
jgi:hypothetical protein